MSANLTASTTDHSKANPFASRDCGVNDPDTFADHALAWFENLFTVGASLGAFFAGFTLSIAASDSTSEPARTFAAISSLLFVLTVLLCAACSLGTTFHKSSFKAWVKARGSKGLVVSLVSLTLQLMLLSAVMFFFLVMMGSARAVGLVGVGFTGIAIAVAVILWALQFSVKDVAVVGKV